jgi:hypothetical protein
MRHSKDSLTDSISNVGRVLQRSRIPFDVVNPWVGREAMIDHAWRFVYGRLIEPAQRAVVVTLAIVLSETNNPPTSKELIRRVCQATDRAAPIVSLAISLAADIGLISTEFEERDMALRLYWLDCVQVENFRALTVLLSKIESVLAAQNRDPNNAMAGSDLIPTAVYYNAWHASSPGRLRK